PAGPRTSGKNNYSAWSAMSGTLEKKQLVHRKNGRPNTFRLTPEGRELAVKVVQKYPGDFGVSNASNNTAHSDPNSSGG
ncbi:unnamed protein product, partial [Ectocarpus fasciculatus]